MIRPTIALPAIFDLVRTWIYQALLGKSIYTHASNIWPAKNKIQKNKSEAAGTTKATIPQNKQRIPEQLDFNVKDNVIDATEINQPSPKRTKLNVENAKSKAGCVT
ncbi:MAG: hypothetical protein GY748_01575 [Planctomycetaceae bacterium]|nr:hypothetical protein [Planctomycetaceae bacterium]